jgi:alkanesulfonate monooxygenase SsuD/methylene tetrahydromethanopterin reductase-like flavin-dependent oxidoreductase (luciferase family)
MRFSINIPNFGEFADARTVATVAAAAEQAGWDGLFVWDHVVHDKRQRRGQPFGDPWMLLTAAALATSRIRLGTLVTPVARRRPEQLARQVATLDSISGGRVIFGAGLGGPLEDEFASFGETTDPVVLAERLDEGLALLNRYWSGEPVDHDGQHYLVRDVTLLPATVQRPARRSGSAGSGHTAHLCAEPRAGTARSRCSPRPGTDVFRPWTRSATSLPTSTNTVRTGRTPRSRSSSVAPAPVTRLRPAS